MDPINQGILDGLLQVFNSQGTLFGGAIAAIMYLVRRLFLTDAKLQALELDVKLLKDQFEKIESRQSEIMNMIKDDLKEFKSDFKDSLKELKEELKR